MNVEHLQQLIVEPLLIAAFFCVYLPAWLVPPQRRGAVEKKREYIALGVAIAITLFVSIANTGRDALLAVLVNSIALHLFCGLLPGLAGRWSLWWSAIAGILSFAIVLALLSEGRPADVSVTETVQFGVGLVLLSLLSTLPNYLLWKIRHRRLDR